MAEVVGGDAVGKPTRLVGGATVRPVPAAEQRVRNHEGDVVGVRPAAPLHREGDVRERHVIIAHADL